MGWIRCVHCEKFRCDFVARTFALIAPVQPVLHQASCSNKTIQNAPKHYEMQQYKGSNGVGRVHSLRKIPKRLQVTNLCINCTSSTSFARVSCTNEILPNAPKHYETHTNMSLESNGVDWVRLLWKIPTWLRGTNFCFNCTSTHCIALSFMQLRNDPKCTQILQNMLKHYFRVPWGG